MAWPAISRYQGVGLLGRWRRTPTTSATTAEALTPWYSRSLGTSAGSGMLEGMTRSTSAAALPPTTYRSQGGSGPRRRPGRLSCALAARAFGTDTSILPEWPRKGVFSFPIRGGGNPRDDQAPQEPLRERSLVLHYLFVGFQYDDAGYPLGRAVAAGALGRLTPGRGHRVSFARERTDPDRPQPRAS